ncbi:MAG: serine/threonine-protein kinase [Isosphaeraceae bacterium]
MTTCPPPHVLAHLGVGSRSDPSLAAHVDDCPVCQAELDRLAQQPLDDPSDSGGFAGSGPWAGRPPEIPGFEVERELGRGGMGVVYLARQPKLDRHVALKLVPGDAAGRRRGLREARAFARVGHPGVVRVYDSGESDGFVYLVLEYVSGGSLKARLRGPLEPRDAAVLVERIALTVEEIHRAGLLHLDLKPSNVLINDGPDTPLGRATPRVSDFGIARPWEDGAASATHLAGPLGTPWYMAPEQVAPDPAALGPATDVYALGAILYELLAGRPPFQAASVVETLDQVRDREPVPVRKLSPSVPRDLETVCTTCLQKLPQRRYASAEALADDLRRFREGRPIAARPGLAGPAVLGLVPPPAGGRRTGGDGRIGPRRPGGPLAEFRAPAGRGARRTPGRRDPPARRAGVAGKARRPAAPRDPERLYRRAERPVPDRPGGRTGPGARVPEGEPRRPRGAPPPGYGGRGSGPYLHGTELKR